MLYSFIKISVKMSSKTVIEMKISFRIECDNSRNWRRILITHIRPTSVAQKSDCENWIAHFLFNASHRISSDHRLCHWFIVLISASHVKEEDDCDSYFSGDYSTRVRNDWFRFEAVLGVFSLHLFSDQFSPVTSRLTKFLITRPGEYENNQFLRQSISSVWLKCLRRFAGFLNSELRLKKYASNHN